MCVVVREMRQRAGLRGLTFSWGDFDLFGVGKRVDFLACLLCQKPSSLFCGLSVWCTGKRETRWFLNW